MVAYPSRVYTLIEHTIGVGAFAVYTREARRALSSEPGQSWSGEMLASGNW